ncbi:hypothetical protein C8R46DRAFT_1187253 [Mycena filopes]|nr:hypothetical protein C8R46DRAFT_1187253 [Mycena filopes]
MTVPNEISTSPFASKLGTNYCPLDDEVLQIRALLTAPLSRLKQIDDQIAELQKAIDELVEERERVRSFVDPHQDLISPFRRLPLDVVQEIFVACLPTHRNCVMSALEAPVLLGRICSAWRSISLGTPRLWARLHIVEPSRSGGGAWSSDSGPAFEGKLAQRLETTKIWLGRSGQCPLSISFQGTHDPPPQPDVDLPANTHLFMDVIISVAPRWEDITLRASSSALEMLSSLTEHDVPMLQRVELSVGPGSPNGRSTFAFLGAPRLKDFTVAAGATDNISELPVRWGNLTHLSAAGFGNGSFSSLGVFELLAKCSQLRECWLYLSQSHGLSSPPDGSASSSIQLPFLHSLHISSFDTPVDDIGNIFRRLSLPKLRYLDLRGQVDLDFTVQTFPLVGILLAFLAVSSCFESLDIDTQHFSSPALVELFRGLPATTTCLHIVDRLHAWSPVDESGILNDAAMAVLTPTPENPGSCPALQELIITRCKAPSDAALLQFLKARMAVPANPLRKVKIMFHRERQFDIFPDIQRLLDDGRIEVSTIYSPPHKSAGAFSPWAGLPEANGWTRDEFEQEFL